MILPIPKKKKSGITSICFMANMLIVFIALIFWSTALLAPLAFDFYNETCPGAIEAINKLLLKAVEHEPRMTTSLVRLHFHNCFVMVINELDCSFIIIVVVVVVVVVIKWLFYLFIIVVKFCVSNNILKVVAIKSETIGLCNQKFVAINYKYCNNFFVAINYYRNRNLVARHL